MTEAGRQKTRERMLKDNPMKKESVRLKSARNHLGQIAWNKGINSEEYKKHYPGGIKGGRPPGYKHTIASKKKMSEIRIRMLATGETKLGRMGLEDLEKNRERMRKNRKNLDFNQKMSASFLTKVTKPHLKIQEILKDEGIKTETNMAFLFGSRYGSIDEVDSNKKIAIYIDGNYWHKYPEGRRWDRYCTKVLENLGWKVIRLWESEINEDIEKCRQKIKKYFE